MAELLILGGRPFAPVEDSRITYRQSGYVKGIITRARAVFDGDDAMDVMGALYGSGLITDLIAALIVPVGESWSIESAKDLARELDGLTNPEEHAVLDAIAVALVQSFLEAKRPSLTTSPSATETTDSAAVPRRQRRKPAAEAGDPSLPPSRTTATADPA
jgi:hypothetical protein